MLKLNLAFAVTVLSCFVNVGPALAQGESALADSSGAIILKAGVQGVISQTGDAAQRSRIYMGGAHLESFDDIEQNDGKKSEVLVALAGGAVGALAMHAIACPPDGCEPQYLVLGFVLGAIIGAGLASAF